jgi:hypothetical protein
MEQQEIKVLLQDLQTRLNKEPNPLEFEPTPDGKARTLPISFVQMTLDEIYLGLWETSEPSYQQIFNEVVATVCLTVTNPVTGKPQRRTGWASVIITQDKDAQVADFNMTKKKNALDLAFPKLGAEAFKNAAQSLGKIFGRDINRKKTDVFKPALKPIGDDALHTAIKRIEAGEEHLIPLVRENFILNDAQMELVNGAKPGAKLLN